MKITMRLLVLAALCLFSSVQAQIKRSVPAIKPLQVGQMLPEVIVSKIHNYSTTVSNLGDMDCKFMIIEIWSGKSGSSSDYQKIEELQCMYEWDLKFIRITAQTETEVLSFLLRHPPSVASWIPFLTDDKFFSKLLPDQHANFIWINTKGIVVAITDVSAVTEANIDLALTDQPISLSGATSVHELNIQSSK